MSIGTLTHSVDLHENPIRHELLERLQDFAMVEQAYIETGMNEDLVGDLQCTKMSGIVIGKETESENMNVIGIATEMKIEGVQTRGLRVGLRRDFRTSPSRFAIQR